MGINSGHDPLLLHDFRDLLQLRSIGADEQEPVFLALLSGGPVVFASGQREQQLLNPEMWFFTAKALLGPVRRLTSRPPFFNTANSYSNSAAPKVSMTWSISDSCSQ